MGSPWTFDKHLLLMAEYNGELRPTDYKFPTAAFWLRVYDLPLGHRNTTMAERLGRAIGNLRAVDTSMEVGGGARFLRFRVEIDISKPLRRGIRIGKQSGKDEIWGRIKYERLPIFCSGCGILGHTSGDCDDGFELENIGKMQYGEWLRASPFKGKPGAGLGIKVINSNKVIQPECSESMGSPLHARKNLFGNHQGIRVDSNPHLSEGEEDGISQKLKGEAIKKDNVGVKTGSTKEGSNVVKGDRTTRDDKGAAEVSQNDNASPGIQVERTVRCISGDTEAELMNLTPGDTLWQSDLRKGDAGKNTGDMDRRKPTWKRRARINEQVCSKKNLALGKRLNDVELSQIMDIDNARADKKCKDNHNVVQLSDTTAATGAQSRREP